MTEQEVPRAEKGKVQPQPSGSSEGFEELILDEELTAAQLANAATEAKTLSKKVALVVGVVIISFMVCIILAMCIFKFFCGVEIASAIFIAPIASLTTMTIALLVAAFLQDRQDTTPSSLAREGLVRPAVSAASQGTIV